MNAAHTQRGQAWDWHRLAVGGLIAAALLLVVYFGWRSLVVDANGPVRLQVAAFSTQAEVLTQAILPAFEQTWEAETGRDLTIESVFGPSATLAGQINLGTPADVAVLSNEQDINRLRAGGVLRRDAQAVIVSQTPMVIVTRPGNPAGLAEFADLARPGVRVVHPDPRTSGAGAWGVLAEYGAVLLQSGDRSAAEEQLRAIWRNVRALPPSARAALTMFELGAGDALVTYEQDARLAQERGVPLEVVIPSRTILTQQPAVVVDDNVSLAERPAAEALVRYLQSAAGQQAFQRYHWRSAQDGAADLPQSFTVQEIGGWPANFTAVIDGFWQREIKPQLDLEAVD